MHISTAHKRAGSALKMENLKAKQRKRKKENSSSQRWTQCVCVCVCVWAYLWMCACMCCDFRLCICHGGSKEKGFEVRPAQLSSQRDAAARASEMYL